MSSAVVARINLSTGPRKTFLTIAVSAVVMGSLASPAIADRISRLAGPNGTVRTISEPAADGTRYIGGDFTAFDQWDTGYGALTSPTSGKVNPAFPKVARAGGNGVIKASTPDGSGGFYVGGNFSSVDGITVSNLAHVNADGSVDTGWTPAANGEIRTIQVVGSTVYVGGLFSTVNGDTREGLAAISTAGALLPWSPKLQRSDGSGGSVHSLKADGTTLYAVGSFSCAGTTVFDGSCTNSGETARGNAAAFDMTTGNLTAWNPDLGYIAESVDTSSSRAYIVGQFSTANGGTPTTGGIAVSKTTGQLIPGWSVTSGQAILSVAVQGSTVYVSGYDTFTGTDANGNPTTRNHTQAVDATSGAVLPWNPNPSGYVYTVVPYGSSVYLGGLFGSVGGEVRSRAAKVDAVTGALESWNPLCSGEVPTISPSASGVFVGTNATTVGGTQRIGAAAVDSNSNVTAWNPSPNSLVRDIAVDGSDVYLAGAFDEVGGDSHIGIAKVNNTSGAPYSWNPSTPLNNFANAVTVSGSRVYVGGAFGTPRVRAAAFSTSNATLESWNPGVNGNSLTGAVTDIVASGSSIYLSGEFASPRNYLAEVDPATGEATLWAPALNGAVNSIAISGSSIYAGGSFSQVGSDNRSRLARISLTTGQADSWNPGADGTVRTLALSGSTLFAGGDFTTAASEPHSNIAAISTSTGSAVAGWAEANAPVLALQATSPNLYAGGSFTTIGSEPRRYSAQIGFDGAVGPQWPALSPFAYALTVTKSGTGSGSVTSSPAAIDCGSSCSASFADGTSVTLTASPASESTFAGWSGDGCSGTGSCTVTMSQARSVTATFDAGSGPSPVEPDVGISINNGAKYTNNRNVRLKLVWPLSSTLARIANNGGFGDAQNRALASSVNWRLSSSGPESRPKTVYVRFLGSGTDSQTFTDGIILDRTAPKVTRATMTRGRTARGLRSYAVSLRGNDGTSGVSTFQITTDRSKPGSLKRFDRSFTYRSRSAKPKLYVRIRDRAGNNSGWKRVS